MERMRINKIQIMIKNCLLCKKDFKKRATENKNYWNKKKYCSLECKSLAMVGKNSAHWQGGKITIICLHCKQKFKVWSYRFKANVRFCSFGCRNKYLFTGISKGLGRIPWNKGKGILTSKERQIRSSQEYILWRTAILMRDNYTCQTCGTREGKFHVDHIKSFSLYPQLRLAIDNGRTLCVECHRKTDTYGYRERKIHVRE